MRSVFFLRRKGKGGGGGGVEPLNRDSVRDISKLVARFLSLQRSGTKGEALSPLIFFKRNQIFIQNTEFLEEYWLHSKVLSTIFCTA